VTDIMSEISAASTEQSLGIEQVNQAITQMDEVTQQNAALVEQAAAAAESLEEQAARLSETVAQFKLGADTTFAAPRALVHKPAHKPAIRSLAAAKKHRAPPSAIKPTSGNTALAAKNADEDWAEF
jgi:methyl-accepting chemotaxis protein